MLNDGITLFCSVLLVFSGFAREIPPASKERFDCGIPLNIPTKTLKGRTHYFLFPLIWAPTVKPLTQPQVTVQLTTNYEWNVNVAVFLRQRAIKRAVFSRDSPIAINFPHVGYADRVIARLVADQDIAVLFTVQWLNPADLPMSYSYWSIPRATLHTRYKCVAPRSLGAQQPATIIIVPTEFGKTFVTIHLPDSPGLRVTTPLEQTFTSGQSIVNYEVLKEEVMIVEAQSGDLSGATIVGSNFLAVWCGRGPTQAGIRSDAALEMMPAVRDHGTRFVLPFPSASAFFPRSSLYSLKVVTDSMELGGPTQVTINFVTVTSVKSEAIELSFSLVKRKTIGGVLSTTTGQDVFDITSTQPILVAVVFYDTSSYHKSLGLMNIPPVSRWPSHYVTRLPNFDGGIFVYSLLRTQIRDSLRLNSQRLANFSTFYPSATGEFTLARTLIGPGRMVLNAKKPFGALFFGTYSNQLQTRIVRSVFMSYFGHLATARTCYPCLDAACDFRDNDCDGFYSEEACNGVDDDNDNLVDEDCCLDGSLRAPAIAGGVSSGNGGTGIGGVTVGGSNTTIDDIETLRNGLIVAGSLFIIGILGAMITLIVGQFSGAGGG